MNKLNYLVLPLMAIPFIASCNKTTTEVNESEFNKAISNDGIEYLQLTEIKNNSDMIGGKTNTEVAPGVSHFISTREDRPSFYMEMYAKETDDNEVVYTYRDKKDSEYASDRTMTLGQALSSHFYENPNSLSIKKILESPSYYPLSDVGYSKFSYEDKTKSYFASFEIAPGDINANRRIDVSISFNNKKVSEAKIIKYEIENNNEKEVESRTFTYSYNNEIIPVYPH